MLKNKWYSVMASAFGVDPFGSGELSDKVRTQPYGHVGGDSKTGLFEPSSGKSHANDYFSESKNNESTEKRLNELNEKRIKFKKKKRKDTQKKESFIYSIEKQSSTVLNGEDESSPLNKFSQWGFSGPTLPFWSKGDFKHKSYTQKMKAKEQDIFSNKKNLESPINKVKKTSLEQEVESNPFKKALRSSVTIRTTDKDKSEIGSGFFINESMILTCFHVVSPRGDIESPDIQITFDGQNFPARIFAYDLDLDMAVLIIDSDFESKSYFPFLNEDIQQGDDIIIVGTPLGFENMVSDGIVSSGQSYSVEEGGPNYLFISADIAPGNSGGPVIDKKKEAIAGMVAAIVSREEDISGLSAVIPANEIKRFLDENAIKYNKI